MSGIGTAIAVAMRPEFSGFQHLKSIVIPWLISSAACDILITVTLTLHLVSQDLLWYDTARYSYLTISEKISYRFRGHRYIAEQDHQEYVYNIHYMVCRSSRYSILSDGVKRPLNFNVRFGRCH